MVRVSLKVQGAGELRQALEQLDARINAPALPLMQTLSQDWASKFQSKILEGRLDLPEHNPVTIKIRAFYGHDGKQKLVRAGDLVHSIEPLEVTDSGFEVGTEIEYAAVLFHGGTVVEKSGRTHQVPPFPFIELDDELLADTDELIAEYFMPEAA